MIGIYRGQTGRTQQARQKFSRFGEPRARLAVALLVAFCSAFTAGCGSVAVYERGHLAHRTMKPDDAASGGQAHIYAIQEGAMGGTVGVSSGCGCN